MGQPFVVQLVNCPGELSHLARALNARGVNVERIAGCGSGEHCCALLRTDNDEWTEEVLRSIGFEYDRGDCVTIEVADSTDAVDLVSAKLAAASVTIHRHCIVARGSRTVELGFAVDDAERARQALALPTATEVATARG